MPSPPHTEKCSSKARLFKIPVKPSCFDRSSSLRDQGALPNGPGQLGFKFRLIDRLLDEIYGSGLDHLGITGLFVESGGDDDIGFPVLFMNMGEEAPDPSMPGMTISVRTRSTGVDLNTAIASTPSPATRQWYPSELTRTLRVMRTSSSSSTISTNNRIFLLFHFIKVDSYKVEVR